MKAGLSRSTQKKEPTFKDGRMVTVYDGTVNTLQRINSKFELGTFAIGIWGRL
jgi:hypothetical protein